MDVRIINEFKIYLHTCNNFASLLNCPHKQHEATCTVHKYYNSRNTRDIISCGKEQCAK